MCLYNYGAKQTIKIDKMLCERCPTEWILLFVTGYSQIIFFCGTYRHKTGTWPPSFAKPQQPTIYIENSEFYLKSKPLPLILLCIVHILVFDKRSELANQKMNCLNIKTIFEKTPNLR